MWVRLRLAVAQPISFNYRQANWLKIVFETKLNEMTYIKPI